MITMVMTMLMTMMIVLLVVLLVVLVVLVVSIKAPVVTELLLVLLHDTREVPGGAVLESHIPRLQR